MKGKKLTNEEFVERINKIYDEKYDLSKSDVNKRDEKGRVCIICPEHGEFWKTPNNILSGHGCPKCSFEKMGENKTQTNEWFIKKSKQIHGDKYDYSKVEYKGNRYNVKIICPKHGEFIIQASNHLKGKGCQKCSYENISNNKTKTTEDFIEKAKQIHGDKYDYSKVEYEGAGKKICIICPKHGEFWQNPNVHLSGCNCPKCAKENMPKKYDNETFIKKAKQIHGDKYDYSKLEYKGAMKKVCIICQKHGEFWQLPNAHLSGAGCPKCANNQKITTEEFINRAEKIHGKKYDYSKVNYKWSREKIEIICHKKDKNGIEHGSFFATPHSHLEGSGCPKCKQNYKLENEVRKILIENGIDFEEKPTLEGLKYKHALKPDFFIPSKKIIIECQGEQHFKPVNFGGVDENKLNKQHSLTKLRDLIKREYCDKNNIKLIEYTHLPINDKNLIKTKERLLKEILSYDT